MSSSKRSSQRIDGSSNVHESRSRVTSRCTSPPPQPSSSSTSSTSASRFAHVYDKKEASKIKLTFDNVQIKPTTTTSSKSNAAGILASKYVWYVICENINLKKIYFPFSSLFLAHVGKNHWIRRIRLSLNRWTKIGDGQRTQFGKKFNINDWTAAAVPQQKFV